MNRFPTIALLVMLLVGACCGDGQAAEPKRVRIYYDRAPQAEQPYLGGRVHALMLQNLLGHFPNVQQIVAPIETYRSGELDDCFAAIYLGTYFENHVPEAFYRDFASTKKNVLWAGYNVWNFEPEELRELWGVEFLHLSKLDTKNLDDDGHYGFFKFYDYKGEEFEKFNQWHPEEPDRLMCAFEIAVLQLLDAPLEAEVVAWARHSTDGRRVPYVVRSENRWYIGESPFSFATEDDRYLIFADLLFDILEEPPRHAGKRPALFRVEDVHHEVPEWQLYRLIDMLHRKDVSAAISVIPVFSDPHGIIRDDISSRLSLMSQNPLFGEFVEYAKQRGASFIFHGVTHQWGKNRNPFGGCSGDDFEFWDRVGNRPVSQDSPDWVVRRLEDGLTILDDSEIHPVAWLTPHYQASPLDYVLFGQLFSWNVGRVIYFPYEARQARRLPQSLAMDIAGTRANGRRLAWLGDLEVDFREDLLPTGQFFPYEIFGDVYGQRIIPEDVGNVQPYMNEQVLRTQTVDDMIRILRRNRVLRDAWGSFFVHPFRLNRRGDSGVGAYPGDTRQLERLIDAARKYGYEFIDLAEFTRKHRHIKRPDPIEASLE